MEIFILPNITDMDRPLILLGKMQVTSKLAFYFNIKYPSVLTIIQINVNVLTEITDNKEIIL